MQNLTAIKNLAGNLLGCEPDDIPGATNAEAIQYLAEHYIAAGSGITETDPTVPDWAKQASKPAYTAEEVGALPATSVIPSGDALLVGDKALAITPLADDADSTAIIAAVNNIITALQLRGVIG